MKSINRKLVLPPVIITGWLLLILAAVYLKKPYFWYPSYELATMSQEAVLKGNYELALNYIREAITSEQEVPGYFIMAGNLEITLKQYEKAERSFKRNLMLTPDEPEAIIGLLEVYIRSDRKYEAEKIYREAEKLKLNPARQLRLIQLQAVAGNYKRALELTDRLIKERGVTDESLTKAFRYAAAAGDWNYILRNSSEIIKTNRNREELFEKKAMALRIRGEKEEAYSLYRSRPSDKNLIPRAQLSMELNLFNEAVPLLKETLEKYPEHKDTRSNLAYALMKTERLQESLSEYSILNQNSSLSSEDRIRYTWVLNRTGNHKEAWEIIKDYEPPSENITQHELKARTAFWAGDMKAASALLKRVLKLKEKR